MKKDGAALFLESKFLKNKIVEHKKSLGHKPREIASK